MIEQIINNEDLIKSHEILLKSFAPIAEEFGLTSENCPSNAAFMKFDTLISMKNKGLELYKLSENKKQVGFVAIEKAPKDKDTYYIEKLAVLPEYRHKGYGKQLVDFAISKIKEKGAKTISIGLMNNHIKLKNWYKRLGFIQTEIKEFSYLPFNVSFMKMNLKTKENLNNEFRQI
jgi:diamine N-acetyltransferase